MAWPDGSLETIKTKPADKDWRLVEIADTSDNGFIHQSPDLVVMEDLPRNAMHAGITGMVQGVIREKLQRHCIPYALVVPSTLKKAATGDGRADKKKMLAHYTQATSLVNKDDNQVDAFWLRQVGLALTGQEHHLADTSTLNKVKEPEGITWQL
ncbi:crossover junction endodeoxyribonuclease RuvC [Glutamicibacter uratoxydans]|nr:crossover junction endodeoxyribonuclease RuvC [Glutamicibacter uratoxydans]